MSNSTDTHITGSISSVSKKSSLLSRPLHVVNVGLQLFSESIQRQQVPVTHVQWEPPAKGDLELLSILDDLL